MYEHRPAKSRAELASVMLGFQHDQLHQVFNHQIALEFLAFFFGKRVVTLSRDEFICSFGRLCRGMEGHDLLRSGMMREKPCDFSCGSCFERHRHFLLLQQRM